MKYFGKHREDGSFGFFMNPNDCIDPLEITDDQWRDILSSGKEVTLGEDGRIKLIDHRTTDQMKMDTVRQMRNRLFTDEYSWRAEHLERHRKLKKPLKYTDIYAYGRYLEDFTAGRGWWHDMPLGYDAWRQKNSEQGEE